MNITELQTAVGTTPDGQWGPASDNALIRALTNTAPNTPQPKDMMAAAAELGCSWQQINAVRMVESAGTGYDASGRIKILFERHRFYRYTGGKHGVTEFSNPTPGGYDVSSWEKLLAAIKTGDVDQAFMSCSWGAFQVMGSWWTDFGYTSPYIMAKTAVASAAGQLELLVQFVKLNRLQDDICKLSSNAASCAPFAAAYNGPGYAVNNYHVKLAKVMEG